MRIQRSIPLVSILSLLILFGCEPTSTVDVTDSTDAKQSTVEINQPLSEFEVSTEDPNDLAPVRFGIGVDPGSVKPGALVTLAIRAKLAPGWHIYAVDKPTEPNKPTQLKLTLPKGISEVGEWDIPEPHAKDGIYQYDNEVVFRRFIHVDEDANPGLYEIECNVAHQTCTESRCMRPTSEFVSVALEVAE